MAIRPLRHLPPLTTLIFALIALAFSLLAITSKKWAARNTYDRLSAPADWVTPIFTIYRSPFIICTSHESPLNNTETNATSTAGQVTSTSSDSIPSPTSTWVVTCENFKPFGHNKTSCEVEAVTNSSEASNIGDVRLCQQLHYAGNFGISSTVFVGLGFLLTAVMVIMTFMHAQRGAGAIRELEPANSIDREAEVSDHAGQKPRSQRSSSFRPSTVASYINLLLVLFLFLGFATGIISQFFAILGLIENLPGQADWASSSLPDGSANHGPWYQDVALSTYATCAWAFSAAAFTVASRTWYLPRWNGLL